WQIAETMIVHQGIDKPSAWKNAIALMTETGIQDAAIKARQYPFEFSGGMLQRVAIAMAIASKPKLLIADEPTTALDVTLQQQMLDILQNLQRHHNLSIILITHDLGVVARIADSVGVMYAGQIIEYGSREQILKEAAHPYTISLKQALPSRDKKHRLKNIPGTPPELINPPQACGFASRCEQCMNICHQCMPPLHADGLHYSRCWLHDPRAIKRAEAEQ
ncbi:MAG: ABC transporter ATP-binding protein, partial [Pseudomonadales bacterium]|nr:ABC transporter ATP-binding protein [Pseudomonadales bacterium]